MINILTKKNSRIQKLLIDFGSNIVAASIPIVVLQILVYPALAKSFQKNDYGEFLTIIGVVNIVVAVFGNTLNNTRLIQNSEYKENNIAGDFNILLSGATSLAFIAVLLVGNTLFAFSLLDNLLVSACVILGVLKTYISVSFRISLNFKMVLILNLFLSAGYFLGTLFIQITDLWILPFFLGELFAFCLLVYSTHLLKEPFRITLFFKKTTIKYFVLIITGLLANITAYLDRFLIYPTMGSEYVSIYTTAIFFGKGLGLIMTPISGVLLSYYAHKNFVMNHKKFWMINGTILVLALIFFFFAKFFSVWFTGLLYPTLVESAKPYILLANTAAIIDVVAIMVTPFVLKYSNIYWQVSIQLLFLIFYFVFSIVLLNSYGLIGFCVAAICSNTLKVLLLYFSGIRTLRTKYQTNHIKVSI